MSTITEQATTQHVTEETFTDTPDSSDLLQRLWHEAQTQVPPSKSSPKTRIVAPRHAAYSHD